jgi:hypothetical protein
MLQVLVGNICEMNNGCFTDESFTTWDGSVGGNFNVGHERTFTLSFKPNHAVAGWRNLTHDCDNHTKVVAVVRESSVLYPGLGDYEMPPFPFYDIHDALRFFTRLRQSHAVTW